MKKQFYTFAIMMQNFGILFENLKNNAEIAREMAEYGYGDTEVEAGKALYDKVVALHRSNQMSSKNETDTYADFDKKYKAVTSVFMKDRKKGKIAFQDDEPNLRTLRLKALESKSIAALVEDMKHFYGTLDQDETLRDALLSLKIDGQHVKSQLEAVLQAEKAYAVYQNAKGESQQATKDKNQAVTELEKWARKMYNVAKIALENKPQLLESLAKLVRG
ncbi:hypothetical protein [Capnocytophaga sp.]|uniref:hypothetical protein n=1 Tax=Capnocytophaga sp. TaxID=44737 RepID=UPI0026DC921F|nr:hypothetical protein [Capnocytophaga sp.]MDO5104745.1 hypothetical protein [Capnocytophaga sp.]